jgi:hypothetical protein
MRIKRSSPTLVSHIDQAIVLWVASSIKTTANKF